MNRDNMFDVTKLCKGVFHCKKNKKKLEMREEDRNMKF